MSSGKGRHSIVTVIGKEFISWISSGPGPTGIPYESHGKQKGFSFRCLKIVPSNILVTNNTECAPSGGGH